MRSQSTPESWASLPTPFSPPICEVRRLGWRPLETPAVISAHGVSRPMKVSPQMAGALPPTRDLPSCLLWVRLQPWHCRPSPGIQGTEHKTFSAPPAPRRWRHPNWTGGGNRSKHDVWISCFPQSTSGRLVLRLLFMGKLRLSEVQRQPEAGWLVRSELPELRPWHLLEMVCKGGGGCSRARGGLRSGRWSGSLFQQCLAHLTLS